MATVSYAYWQENNVGVLFTDDWGDPEPEPRYILPHTWLGYLLREPNLWRLSSTLEDLIVKLRDLDDHIDQAGGDVDAARTLADYGRGLLVRLGDQVPAELHQRGEFETKN
jgi:hypothetical protein